MSKTTNRGWTVLWHTGYFNKQMLKWLCEQHMGNCPEEEDDDAQGRVLKITTNTFLSYSILLPRAKLALAISPALLGHQAHKPQAEIRSSPAHLGLAGARRSHIFWGQTESKAKNTDPSSPLTFCNCPPVQVSNYKQALLSHAYKLCSTFLHLPFYVRLRIKKALWKLLLSI